MDKCLRHAVNERESYPHIDKGGTLTTQTRARRIAQALSGVLMGVLWVSLTVAPAYAIDRYNPKNYAYHSMSIKEFKCLDYIVTRESHWNPKANNPHSSAYGLGQLLNEKSKDAFEQVLHLVAYGRYRYGTMCNGAIHHKKHGWW